MTDRENYHHGDLPNALLEASLKIIREKGLEGFSLRQAAGAVGVDPASVYRHFKNKTALLAEVARRGFSDLAREMETAAGQALAQVVPEQAGGPWSHSARVARERFRAVGVSYVVFAVHNPERFRVMFEPQWPNEDEVRGVGLTGRDPYQLLLDSLDELINEGVICESTERAAVPCWSGVHGLATLALGHSLGLSQPGDVEAAARLVCDTLLAGLAEQAEQPEPGEK